MDNTILSKFLIFLVFPFALSFGQKSIKIEGRVYNASLRRFEKNAIIHICNTPYKTISNDRGKFELIVDESRLGKDVIFMFFKDGSKPIFKIYSRTSLLSNYDQYGKTTLDNANINIGDIGVGSQHLRFVLRICFPAKFEAAELISSKENMRRSFTEVEPDIGELGLYYTGLRHGEEIEFAIISKNYQTLYYKMAVPRSGVKEHIPSSFQMIPAEYDTLIIHSKSRKAEIILDNVHYGTTPDTFLVGIGKLEPKIMKLELRSGLYYYYYDTIDLRKSMEVCCDLHNLRPSLAILNSDSLAFYDSINFHCKIYPFIDVPNISYFLRVSNLNKRKTVECETINIGDSITVQLPNITSVKDFKTRYHPHEIEFNIKMRELEELLNFDTRGMNLLFQLYPGVTNVLDTGNQNLSPTDIKYTYSPKLFLNSYRGVSCFSDLFFPTKFSSPVIELFVENELLRKYFGLCSDVLWTPRLRLRYFILPKYCFKRQSKYHTWGVGGLIGHDLFTNIKKFRVQFNYAFGVAYFNTNLLGNDQYVIDSNIEFLVNFFNERLGAGVYHKTYFYNYVDECYNIVDRDKSNEYGILLQLKYKKYKTKMEICMNHSKEMISKISCAYQLWNN